jgi:hypothetical protein
VTNVTLFIYVGSGRVVPQNMFVLQCTCAVHVQIRKIAYIHSARKAEAIYLSHTLYIGCLITCATVRLGVTISTHVSYSGGSGFKYWPEHTPGDYY